MPVFSDESLSALAEHAPLMRGDELVQALSVAGGGLAIGEHQLYEYAAGTWTEVPYSREAPRKTSVNQALLVGETLYLVGDGGLLLKRRDARNFDTVVLDGVSPRTRNLDWLGAWATPDGRTLYVRAGYDRLLQIDLSNGHTRLFPIPLAGSGGAAPAVTEPLLIGRTRGERDELVLVMGYGVYRFDGREVLPVASFDAEVSKLSFAGPDRATARVGDETVDLPLDGGETDADLGSLSGSERRALAASERRDLMRERQAKSAAAETFWFPTLRVSPGAQFHLGELEGPLEEELGRTSFVLDVAVGVLLAPPTGDRYERDHAYRPIEAWFWPELGYTWTPSAPHFAHAATAGVGFGFGNDFIAGYYKPRGVLGFGPHPGRGAPMIGMELDDGPRLRPGFRHGLSAQAFWGTLGVELSHGMVFFEDDLQHDLRVTLDVNLLPLVWAAVLWGTL